jgi:glycosyltransferase involved in cell wall biosynthesis
MEMSRLLLLSRDRSGLDPASGTAKRWRLLVRANQELQILVLAPITVGWSESGIVVRGTGGSWLGSRLLRAFTNANALKADFISAQDPLELGVLALLLGAKKRVPVEIQDHGGFFDGQPNGEPFWWCRRLFVSLARTRAMVIRTVSPYSLKALASERSSDRLYWLPIAPDDRFRHGTYAPQSQTIVAVGRLVSVKRFSILVDAFAQVKKLHAEAKLIIVGEGPERSSLEARIRAHGLQDSVRLEGVSDPLPWLERAQVFAMPSFHEGWGVAAVEAALVGVPVVMSATGCGSWLAEQGVAELVHPMSVDELAQALIRGFGRTGSPLPSVATAAEIAEAQIEAWSRTLAERMSK